MNRFQLPRSPWPGEEHFADCYRHAADRLSERYALEISMKGEKKAERDKDRRQRRNGRRKR